MVLDDFLALQAFTPYLVFPLAEGKTILTGQSLGDGGRLYVAGISRNATSLIIDTVIDDVDMWVRLVVVTEYHILRIPDAHTPHILTGYLGNLLVIQFVIVFR